LRKVLLIFIAIGIAMVLSACIYNKEAKKLIKDPDVKDEIEKAIIDQVERDYFLPVDVNMKKLKFTFPEGKLLFPVKTSKRIEVPVEIVGEPSYKFKAYISIYDEEEEEYGFYPEQDIINIKEIRKLGSYVLESIFIEMYGEQLDRIKEYDPDIEVSFDLKHDFLDKHIEREEDRRRLMREFSADYNEGKFVDEKHYEALYIKYVEKPLDGVNDYDILIKGNPPCTPRITLKIDYKAAEGQPIDERLADVMAFIEEQNDFPNASYNIHITDISEEKAYERDSLHDRVLKCDW